MSKVSRPDMTTEVTSIEPALTPPDPASAPYRHGFSWLVQMRDGRVLRVDADRCETTNGVLAFYGGPRAELLFAAFEYGDWKRLGLMDRDTGENSGWTVLKERSSR